MLGGEESFTAQDLQHVDPVLSRSFAQLADVAVRKHQLDCDPLLVSVTIPIIIVDCIDVMLLSFPHLPSPLLSFSPLPFFLRLVKPYR